MKFLLSSLLSLSISLHIRCVIVLVGLCLTMISWGSSNLEVTSDVFDVMQHHIPITLWSLSCLLSTVFEVLLKFTIHFAGISWENSFHQFFSSIVLQFVFVLLNSARTQDALWLLTKKSCLMNAWTQTCQEIWSNFSNIRSRGSGFPIVSFYLGFPSTFIRCCKISTVIGAGYC